MNDYQIVEALSKTGKPRATIYLNEKRVEELYTQSVSAISELVKTAKVDAKVSASLVAVFGGEMATGREMASSITLSPLLKAIMIEYQTRQAHQLVDLAVTSPRPAALLIYIGDGHLIGQGTTVRPAETDLPVVIARLIQEERARQESVLRQADDKVRTIVWLGQTRPHFFASVASSTWIDYGHLASYGTPPYDAPPFGILGRYERAVSEITFISPLWIWHDGW